VPSVASFPRWPALLVACAVCLFGAALPAAADDAAAQKHLEKALAHHNAYNEHYSNGRYVPALKEMDAAMTLYAQGEKRFPKNTAFSMGLGVFQNVRGWYPQAAKSLSREWGILSEGFDGDQFDEAKLLAAYELAQAYEHSFDYDSAIKFYSKALTFKADHAESAAALKRCERLKKAFARLPTWMADLKTPDATQMTVVYDETPRTYPGYRHVEYQLARRDKGVRLAMEIPVLYRGDKANRRKVRRHLKQITALVGDCFARSGLPMDLTFRFVRDPKKLPPQTGVNLWDTYRPTDLRMGDVQNWSILSGQGLTFTPSVAAGTVVHEIGHKLGLPHPPYYPEKPYTDVMTAGHPWTAIESKRVYPDDIKIIVAPLGAPAEARGTLVRANELLAAGKPAEAARALQTACKLAPDVRVFHLARANALFAAEDYAAAAAAYTRVLDLTPHDNSVRYFRGVSFSRNQQYKPAIADFTHIVSLHSGGLHAAAYWERATAWNGLGNKKRADADFKKSQQALTNPVPETQPARP